jgi:hypothetical protein
MFPSYLDDQEFTYFEPIDTFNRTDADVAIWYLRNRAIYTGQVQDAFFKATNPSSSSLVGTTATVYLADNDISTLACTEQYSFCNGPTCTPMDGLSRLTPTRAQSILSLNAAQLATFTLIRTALRASSAFATMSSLGEQALLANDLAMGPLRTSAALPPDQWQREVANLFYLALAGVQRVMVQVASPPGRMQVTSNATYGEFIKSVSVPVQIVATNSTSSLYQFMQPEKIEAERRNNCANQKIRSGAEVRSFSCGGLLALLVTGLGLVAICNAVPAICHRRSWRTTVLREHRRREWDGHDVLHLQRCALETRGLGTWELQGDVPLMTPGYMEFSLPWVQDSIGGESSDLKKLPLGSSGGGGEERRIEILKRLQALGL